MFKTISYFLILLTLATLHSTIAQEVKNTKDSLRSSKDSELTTKKSKLGRMLKKVIFKPSKKKVSDKKFVEAIPLENTEGKIIRNIKIITLDPFGQSDTDSTMVPKNWGEKTGNKLHLKTKQFAIRNLLLFKKNTPYNAYNIKESERIIRSQRYVNKVTISEKFTSEANDSIDITVRVLDSWSILPRFSASNSKFTVGFNDRNILGTGQQLEYRFKNNFVDGRNGHDALYTVPNIMNTFISTRAKYFIDLDNNYNKGISIERPFYSPLTKWAGGVFVEQNFRKDTLQALDQVYAFQNFKYNKQDLWLGKAFNITAERFKDDRTTNFIWSARFLNVNYIESPTYNYDPENFFSDEKQILMGIGINTREFVKDTYIFRNGNTEDIPIGRIFGITGGYQYKNNLWRPYLGAQVTFGDYFKWGFLSTNFEIGSFFSNGKTYQTAISMKANYFTRLLSIGNWKFRQFIKPEFVIGINRKDYIADLLNINDFYRKYGYDESLYGKSKMILTLQSQAYTPREIFGFRVNPFLNYSVAVIGNSDIGLLQNKYYSKISLGLAINNDYLVFSSIQLSMSFYPTIPSPGGSLFKTNAIQTTDFGFQTFELAKPRMVEYR